MDFFGWKTNVGACDRDGIFACSPLWAYIEWKWIDTTCKWTVAWSSCR